MKFVIFIFLFFALLPLLALGMKPVYQVPLTYVNGDVVSSTPRFMMGPETQSTSFPNAFRAELFSIEGGLVAAVNFHFPIYIADRPGTSVVDTAKETIYLPYAPGGDRIDILNPEGVVVASVDVSMFADYCGDSKCTASENAVFCPEDCGGGAELVPTIIPEALSAPEHVPDEIVEEALEEIAETEMDTTSPGDLETPESEEGFNSWWIVGIVLLLLVVLFAVSRRKHRQNM